MATRNRKATKKQKPARKRTKAAPPAARPDSKTGAAWAKLSAQLKGGKSVTRADAAKAFAGTGMDATTAARSAGWLIWGMRRKGVLKRVGRGQFALGTKRAKVSEKTKPAEATGIEGAE